MPPHKTPVLPVSCCSRASTCPNMTSSRNETSSSTSPPMSRTCTPHSSKNFLHAASRLAGLSCWTRVADLLSIE
eukprot:7104540-Prymnesium_polylepis.1